MWFTANSLNIKLILVKFNHELSINSSILVKENMSLYPHFHPLVFLFSWDSGWFLNCGTFPGSGRHNLNPQNNCKAEE